MKVYYLSISTFADNQLNLLRHLAEDIDITYGVIIPCKRANFTAQELRSSLEGQSKIKFEAFHLKYRFRDPRVIKTYLEIIRSIKKADPDVVYFTNFDQVYINLLLLLINNNKTVIGFHDVENHSNTRFDFLTNLGKNILFKNFKHFHTYSQSQTDILKKRYTDKKVYMIPLPLIGFGEGVSNAPQNKMIHFLFFGNILPYKGLDILLHAVNRLSKKHKNFRLVVAGRSNEWDKLYENIVEDREVMIKQVRFIENSEISGFFDMADYVILPYRDTTQSGPLMISYHYNVPVIASNAVGFREFIKPGISGYVFDLDKENDLDRLLEDALHRSPAEYNQLKETQKQFVEANFSMNSIVERYRTMFNEVSSDGRKSA